jgi:omega-6 fatty acid desaturase (delta-12 desaturase)
MIPNSGDLKTKVTKSHWYHALTQFENPDLRKALGQIFNTFLPYIALWGAMAWMVNRHVSLWFVAPLIVVAAGLLVRIFIVFHDCGHGSFFGSHRANLMMGYLSGVLTFTPYEEWRFLHARHHASAGDLDRRGTGDIKTMTVEEYLAAPKFKQLGYRIFRNPLFLFIPGAFIEFVFVQRFPHKLSGPRERRSVHITNAIILALVLLASWLMGWRTYLLLQAPIISIAAALGVWLFYVQHQYEGVYWAHHQEWDPIKAALHGSSYFQLPKVLQWFSGNIGLHHIHHLRPRIPNYNLQECYDKVPELQEVEPLTLGKSFKCLTLNLWDEQQQQLVSFRTVHARQRPPQPQS